MIFFYLFLGVLTGTSCVDRIDFGVEFRSRFPIVVEGFISDNPGPYTVTASNSFDIDSEKNQRTPAIIKRMVLMSSDGDSEVMKDMGEGKYQTAANGIRGVSGKAYHLTIELPTGETYESIPDTLPMSGTLHTIYYKFGTKGISEGKTNYAFDIYFDGSADPSKSKYFAWKFTGTFKVDTQPELDDEGEPCEFPDCPGCSICNKVWKCSGLRNYGTPSNPVFKLFEPCSCCSCWYNIFNEKPILSDAEFLRAGGQFTAVRAGTVPVHQWIFQHKVYAEVKQLSLSSQSYQYFKAIRDQKNAVNSLFQPVSGKIRSNFRQTNGEARPIEGLFYATAVDKKVIILDRTDIPDRTFSFPLPQPVGANCKFLFPNSTNVKPDFWED